MERDLMNTKEVAEYLGIHEKQVYALIKEKKIPCTRLTGKWIFPKHLIDAWINDDARSSFSSKSAENHHNYILAAGSNDPILDILLNDMQRLHPDLTIFNSSTGSTGGLKLLSDGLTDVAFCHLISPETGEYNIPHIESLMAGKKVAVVHLFHRDIGFITARNSKYSVKTFEDLTQEGLVFINRQKGSGTRVLLDTSLKQNEVDFSKIEGYDNEVTTHFEVGLEILAGKAHAGIATVAAAKLFDLPFERIKHESFDMVLMHSTFFSKTVQTFIETLKSDEFKEKTRPLGDYDFSESGKIIYSAE